VAASVDAVVVGGGLHGLSSALHLARRGLRAVVLERDYCGRHASGVNAGGVRTLSRDVAEIPLALAALAVWRRIGELVDDDCGFASHGQYRVAETDADVAEMRRRLADLAARGYMHERWLDAAELRARIPALAPYVRGALGVDTDGAANPFRTTFAFRRKAEALGAIVREGTAVREALRDGGAWRVKADREAFVAPVLVNCAGAWADRIAAALGEAVPLEPIAPMMMVTCPMPHFLDPVILGAGRPLSFKQMANGTVLIGGGRRARVDRDTQATALDFAELGASARTVHELFPIMRGAIVNRCWAGIEARMPDDLPVIGPSATLAGAVHAFGFSAHGFALAPIVGRIVADLVVDGATDLPIASFAITRFSDSVLQAAAARRV
jgi:sarcosine oxidase subunit beta